LNDNDDEVTENGSLNEGNAAIMGTPPARYNDTPHPTPPVVPESLSYQIEKHLVNIKITILLILATNLLEKKSN
jgi:hypothetical protein